MLCLKFWLRYFKKMVFFFSDDPFYSSQVRFPTTNSPTPPAIANDHRFRRFDRCIGAVDGTHIRAFATLADHAYMRNRKGYISQNCLFICDFDFRFIYGLTGWDGSSADASIWNDARAHDLRIPEGRYLLGDAGFGTCDALLVPYRGVRYHLKEWRLAANTYVFILLIFFAIKNVLLARKMPKNFSTFDIPRCATQSSVYLG